MKDSLQPRRRSAQSRFQLLRKGDGVDTLIQRNIAAMLSRIADRPITRGRPAATLFTTIIAAWLFGPLALGQEIARDAVSPPDPASAMAAYSAVEAMVRSGDLSYVTDADLPASPVVSVTLRRLGSVVASVTETAVSQADEATTLRRAATRAWDRARKLSPAWGDALDRPRAQTFRDEIMIEIELAGALAPLAKDSFFIQPGDPLRLQQPPLNPGHDGFAARDGRFAHAITPAHMLREDHTPREAMTRAIGAVADDPELALQPLDAITARGIRMYKFETTHVGQWRAGGPPRFFARGGSLKTLADIQSTEAIAGLASNIGQHLAGRMWPGVEPLGLRGDYDPVTDTHEPLIAPPFEQALAAASLLRAAKHDGIASEARLSFESAARAMLDALGANLAPVQPQIRDTEANKTPDSVSQTISIVDAAAISWALREMSDVDPSASFDELTVNVRETLASAFHPATGFSGAIPPAALGMVALGLVAIAETPEELARADSAIRQAFESARGPKLVAQMPQLLWAEIMLADRRGADRFPSEQALVELRTQILQFQLQRDDVAPRDEDLLGGIVLLSGRDPLPTAQSLRPIAALASMLADKRMPAADQPALLRQLDATRFIRQLAADEAECSIYRRPERALYGVRSALWRQMMPTEACALAITSLVDTLRAVEAP